MGSKKEIFGDTAADIEETYHFFHKVNIACECVCVCAVCMVWGLGYG